MSRVFHFSFFVIRNLAFDVVNEQTFMPLIAWPHFADDYVSPRRTACAATTVFRRAPSGMTGRSGDVQSASLETTSG